MAEQKSDLPQLKKVFLGRTGLRVSELCLGAMTFSRGDTTWGTFPVISDEESFAILDKFVEYGGNFIDTANIYSHGQSEEIIGDWLQAASQDRDGRPKVDRESLVIATKVRFPMGRGANDSGLSRKHILKSVEDSLKRLKTDYIDLLQVHSFDEGTPLEETLSTLNDLVRAGKVRYIGASNFAGWQLQKALSIAKELKFERFISLQAQYSLLCRSPEWELFPLSKDAGLAYLPWSPLKGGWLTGRYSREAESPEEGGRVAWAEKVGWKETAFSGLANEHTWGIVDKLKEIASAKGKSVAQVALRWTIQKHAGVTTIPIIGVRKIKNLEDNIGAAFFELSAEEMEALDKASEVQTPYPYSLLTGRGRMDPRTNPNL